MRFNYRGREVDIVGYSDDDWIYSKIRDSASFYEKDLLEYMLRVLPSDGDGCFIDIGANIGNHSVCIGRYSGMPVVCFEPNPELKPILERNLTVNQCEFRIYDCALGAASSTGMLEVPDDGNDNVGMGRIAGESSTDQASEGVRVSIRTLNEMLAEIEDFAKGRPVCMMKIDVEGMELSVLQGAESVLNRYHPDLFLEALTEDDFIALKTFLARLDYKMAVRWPRMSVVQFVHASKLGRFGRLKLQAIARILKLRKRWARFLKRTGLIAKR